jgi:hypothetical protein
VINRVVLAIAHQAAVREAPDDVIAVAFFRVLLRLGAGRQDEAGPGHRDLLSPQGLDNDEAEPGEGHNDDEEDRGRDDDGGWAAEFVACDFRQRLTAAAHRRGQHEHVLDSPRETDTDEKPEQPRHVAILDRQHRTDERAGPGNGGEVMAEEDPFLGRMIILAVIEEVRRRRAEIVNHRDAGGEESAVVTVGDGEHGQDAEEDRHGVVNSARAGGCVVGVEEEIGPDVHAVVLRYSRRRG